MVDFWCHVLFESLPYDQWVISIFGIVPGPAVSKPCLPIHSKMNEASSFSIFYEYGPLKIRLQNCLNFANSSLRSAGSQFISGLLNPVAIVIWCVKLLNDKENNGESTWFVLVYPASDTMTNSQGELNLVYFFQTITANGITTVLS